MVSFTRSLRARADVVPGGFGFQAIGLARPELRRQAPASAPNPRPAGFRLFAPQTELPPIKSSQYEAPQYHPAQPLIRKARKSGQLMVEILQFLKTFIAPDGQLSKK